MPDGRIGTCEMLVKLRNLVIKKYQKIIETISETSTTKCLLRTKEMIILRSIIDVNKLGIDLTLKTE